jgi:hypothetical protein
MTIKAITRVCILASVQPGVGSTVGIDRTGRKIGGILCVIFFYRGIVSVMWVEDGDGVL